MSYSLSEVSNWKISFTLAQIRSITRASIELGVDATKVGRVIGQLEKELEEPLFNRSATPLQLTSYGKEVLKKLVLPLLKEWELFSKSITKASQHFFHHSIIDTGRDRTFLSQ